MKNIIDSIIVIIFTIITVCVLIAVKNHNCKIHAVEDEVLVLKNSTAESRLKNKMEQSEDRKVNKNTNIKGEAKTPEINNKAVQNSDTCKSQAGNKSKTKENINSAKTSSSETTKTSDGAVNKSETADSNAGHIESSDEDINDIPVFKVAKGDALNRLSVSDKATLLLISKGLSREDYDTIQQDLNSSDDKQGLSNAIRLLKSRLNSNDFNKIKEIAAKIINLNALTF